MKQEIYTPMEKILIDFLTTQQKETALLQLDLLLLEAESQVGLMDGLPLEVEGEAL